MSLARVTALLVVVGCGNTQPPPPAPEFPAGTTPSDGLVETVRALQVRMHQRYEASRRVERAIVFGDLERAREEARTIVSLEERDVLPAWRPSFEAVREAARAVDEAPDLETAARRTGTLGTRCMECHVASKARIVIPVRDQPPAGGRLGPQMQGHEWAALAMWDGLVAPSDEHWQRGAALLADVRSDMVAHESFDVAARMKATATSAVSAPRGERGELYGNLLASCARCHSTLRDGITR